MNTQEFQDHLRVLNFYPRNKCGEKYVHLCTDDVVSNTYEKLRKRGTVVALAKGSSWCEDCQYTACWDYKKAIVCNIKKVEAEKK